MKWTRGEPRLIGYYWCKPSVWRESLMIVYYEGTIHGDGSKNTMPFQTIGSDEIYSLKDLGILSEFLEIEQP